MGFRYLGQPKVLGEVLGNSQKRTTIQDYLRSLGAVLLYDGTEVNRGSAGSAFDGTASNVTYNAADGMIFNGTTSSISISPGAAWTDYIDSGAYTIICIARATTVGENSSGRIWTIGALLHTGTATTTPSLQMLVARTSSASSTHTNPITAYPSARFIAFMGWSGSAISGHTAKTGETALTGGTDLDGSGTVTAVGVNSLFLGNRSGGDRTWDGSIRLWALVPGVMTLAQRTAALAAAQPLLNAA